MNENDYIAEYVKENHPSILGVDFAIWKFKRQIAHFAKSIVDVFRQIPTEELRKMIEEEEQNEYK